MIVKKLSDHEVAVIIDALAFNRRAIRGKGHDTPNIDSALEKINSMMTPGTFGLWLADEDVTPTDWQAYARDALDPDPAAMQRRLADALPSPDNKDKDS